MKTKGFLMLVLAMLTSVCAMAQETTSGETLYVERTPGLGYTATTATVDFTAAKTFLGVDEITTDMLRIVNPDGNQISDYASYDGWFNADGQAEGWGSNTKICVKFFQAVPDGIYTISDMNGAGVAGATYTVKWALVANDKTYTYTINVTFFAGETLNVESETLNIERVIGQGYYATTATVDFTAAKAFLGVDEITTDMLRIVNPDGNQISDYAPYDGWFNAEGQAEGWNGNTTKICVKFFQAVQDGKYEICDMNGADVAGTTYTVKWTLVTNGKTYTYTINVTFKAPSAITQTYADLTEELNVEYLNTTANFKEKIVSLTDEQVQTILEKLELSSLAEATVYGYNPSDQSLTGTYTSYDGWHDANGDLHNFTGNSDVPVCVKCNDDGLNYSCYNIQGCAPQTIGVYWAIANDTKYVLVKINFTYKTEAATVNISEAGYATYYNEYSYIMPEGLTGYTISFDEDNNSLSLNESYIAGNLVPHRTGVLLEGNAGSYNLTLSESEDATAPNENRLGGSSTAKTIEAWNTNILLYKLANGENGLGWYWDSADGRSINCGANRCYLWLTDEEAGLSAGAAPRFFPILSDEATAISTVTSKSAGNRRYYDMQGRPVNQPVKGFYLMNTGKEIKKVFIK